MIKVLIVLVLLLSSQVPTTAQFSPAVGQPGCIAIHKDSSIIIDWAKKCSVVRGYLQINDTSLTVNNTNRASYGFDTDATGKADNKVVSLGDKGYAILEFDPPICNGAGYDFAVFENAFDDFFLELAFVEVSSDGENFFRFPAISLTDTQKQIDGFGKLETSKIHNLAGKFKAEYGTPFDLEDLPDSPLLDKCNIKKVKIIDVGGSIDPAYASYDSKGNIINDPFPTPFASGGFDLDAVGVINNTHNINNSMQTLNKNEIKISPNPVKDELILNLKNVQCLIFDFQGKLVKEIINNEGIIKFDSFADGIYFIKVIDEKGNLHTAKFVKIN